MSENGEAPNDEIVIRLVSRNPWRVHIDGRVENLNLALNLLAEATRALEMEWRLAAAQEYQAIKIVESQTKLDVSSLLTTDLKNPTRRH